MTEPRTVFKIRLPRQGRHILGLVKILFWLLAIIAAVAIAQWRLCVHADKKETVRECLLP